MKYADITDILPEQTYAILTSYRDSKANKAHLDIIQLIGIAVKAKYGKYKEKYDKELTNAKDVSFRKENNFRNIKTQNCLNCKNNRHWRCSFLSDEHKLDENSVCNQWRAKI